MSNLQIFENQEFGKVRMIEIDNKPYAVGVDVARALGYSIPHKAIRDNCKGVLTWNIPTNGGEQQMLIISEGDIYRLIVKAADQSKNQDIKAKAEKFERWIFDEVIPSIRKHGAYMTPETIEKALCNPDFLIQLATKLKQEQETNRKLRQENAELKPKAELADQITNADNMLNFTQLAKALNIEGFGRNNLLKFLREKGILMQGEHYNNLPKQAYIQQGYFKAIVKPVDIGGKIINVITPLVTPKGIKFIYELIKKEKDVLINA